MLPQAGWCLSHDRRYNQISREDPSQRFHGPKGSSSWRYFGRSNGEALYVILPMGDRRPNQLGEAYLRNQPSEPCQDICYVWEIQLHLYFSLSLSLFTLLDSVLDSRLSTTLDSTLGSTLNSPRLSILDSLHLG